MTSKRKMKKPDEVDGKELLNINDMEKAKNVTSSKDHLHRGNIL